MSKKRDRNFKSVKSMMDGYSGDRVTPQVLHAIADYLCYAFHFLNTEGNALYLYDEQAGYYRMFDNTYAMRFLEENSKSIGIDYALRSKDCKEIVALLKSKVPETPLEKCKTNSYKVLFSDTCFDVRSRTVGKPCKEDFFFSRIDHPLNWDKEYIPSPETIGFIRGFTGGDSNLEDYLWEMIGEMLGEFRNKFFYVLHGVANAGKTTLTNMIRRICGDSSCVALGIKDLASPFNIAELQGKKLIIDSDMDATALNARDIALLKKVTGLDYLQGNRKYQPQFYFECKAKLLVCLNGDFAINSSEDLTPLYKRAVVFELKNSIPQEEQRYDLDTILDRDRSWILQQAMKGLCRLYENNFVFSWRESPEKYMKNTSETEKDEGIRKFVRELCKFEKGGIETVANIYNAYERFAEGYGYEPASKKYLTRFLKKSFGVEMVRTSTERNYSGIKLMTDDRLFL